MISPVRFLCGMVCLAASSLFAACGAPATPVALSNPGAVTPAPTQIAPTSPPPSAPTQSAQTGAPTDAPTQIPTVAGATLAPPPTAMPAPTQTPMTAAPTNYFGISTNGEVITDDQVRALAILGGAQMVRTSVGWNQVEPTKDKYNWNWSDHAVRTLTDNHFEPLVLILDNPAWAATTKCGPVTDLLAFDQFVRKLAARYPNVKYWALYNEPDNSHGADTSTGGCFGGDDLNGNGKPDYADYAQQLQIAWRAVHAANPNAQLVMGAVAFDNFDEATAPPGYPGGGQGGIFNAHFLDQLFGYMQANPPPPGEKYFDVLSFNFYNVYAPYWEGRSEGKGVSAKANVLNNLLHQYGLQAPLLVSETGVDSIRFGNQGQSAILTQTFVRGLSSGIAHMIWWTFQDFADSAPPPSNTWKYGLLDQNATPKPAYAAFQAAVKLLNGAQFLQPLSVQGGEGYVFQKGGAGVAVVWASSETPVTITFSGSALQVTDMYGATRVVADGSADDHAAAAGQVALTIGPDPLYIQAVR
jgi:hypothetical protein